MRKKYRIISEEGYPLYDSTLREPVNASYILACLENTLQSTEGQGKDFKSSFAHKAKSDLIAYERLWEKREAELDEELHTRPFEDIAVEEFLDQLPKPQIEEVVEPEPTDTSSAPKEHADTPMDTSGVKAGTGDLPQSEMPGTAETEAPDVPMEADAPESSPQGEASGGKAEPTEGSPQGEESEIKDEHMGATEEVNDEDMATEDSSPDEEHVPPDISPGKDDGLHDQGIWGRVGTAVDPEAFKAATSAEEKNEQAFENMENAKDNKGLERAEEFKYFCEVIFSGEERGSPMRMLIQQKDGYSTSGLYHSGVRDDPVSAFKVQHMAWRAKVDPHPITKYTLSENDLFKHMCTMDPIYNRYPAKKEVVSRSGDVRSTLDDQLMEKASNVKETALEVQEALSEKAISLSKSGNPASREELMNAMLHFFLGSGVDEEEIGDLSLEKMPIPQLHCFGLAEDGPVPVFTCKSKYAALIVNLGSFSWGRKQTAPSAFSAHLEYDYSQPSKGSLVKSLAQSKSHLFMACEASEVNQGELKFLRDRGWSVLRNRSGDIMIGSRTNFVGENMRRLAGSTLVGEAHSALPLTYMIVEIVYGKTFPIGQQGNRDDFPMASLTNTLTRAGSDRIRVCVFHLNNVCAAGKVALAHEALGTMFADCLHYQVDLLGGDANMAMYRATGGKQESVDIRGSMYQTLLDYFLEAWAKDPQSPYLCFPRAPHVSANSLCLLKQYEDLLGG